MLEDGNYPRYSKHIHLTPGILHFSRNRPMEMEIDSNVLARQLARIVYFRWPF